MAHIINAISCIAMASRLQSPCPTGPWVVLACKSEVGTWWPGVLVLVKTLAYCPYLHLAFAAHLFHVVLFYSTLYCMTLIVSTLLSTPPHMQIVGCWGPSLHLPCFGII